MISIEEKLVDHRNESDEIREIADLLYRPIISHLILQLNHANPKVRIEAAFLIAELTTSHMKVFSFKALVQITTELMVQREIENDCDVRLSLDENIQSLLQVAQLNGYCKHNLKPLTEGL